MSDTGTLNRGLNVTSVSHPSGGRYQVTMNFDVTGCAYYATTGDTGVIDPSEDEAGYARVGQTAGNPNQITVIVFRQWTVRDDEPFHLFVTC